MSGNNGDKNKGDNRKNETTQNDDEDHNTALKLAKITPMKKLKSHAKTLTRNSFTIPKRKTRSVKRDATKSDKNETPRITKITPNPRKELRSKQMDTDKDMDNDKAMNEDTNEEDNSDEGSDIHDTNLTLTRHNDDDFNANNDAVFNRNDTKTVSRDDGIFNYKVTFNNNDNNVIFNTDEDLLDAESDPTSDKNNHRRIIPSLKTQLATDIPLKDSSLQEATQVLQSNHQVLAFTTKLDEHDTQGWEQVKRPKRRKSDKTSNL